jgi:nitrite reductase/ring-hydroxylating ferredoxin subunit
MDEWHEIADVDPTSAEFPLAAEVDGEPLVIFKTGDTFSGVQRFCPHQEADFLTKGKLTAANRMIRCQLHGYVFKLADGRGAGSSRARVTVYDVDADGGTLKVKRKAE